MNRSITRKTQLVAIALVCWLSVPNCYAMKWAKGAAWSADKVIGLGIYLPFLGAALVPQYFVEKNLNEPLPPEQEKYVRALGDTLCQKMGLKPSSIQYTLGNSSTLNPEKMIEGSPSAEKTILTGIKRIAVSKEFFDLPENQKRGVLAHELFHLKNHDCETRLAAYLACIPLGYMTGALGGRFATKILSNIQSALANRSLPRTAQAAGYAQYALHLLSRSLILQATIIAGHPGASQTELKYDKNNQLIGVHYPYHVGIGPRLMGMHSRYMEKRADLGAASIGEAQGLLDYFSSDQKYDNSSVTNSELSKALASNRVSSHPSNQERINYLKP